MFQRLTKILLLLVPFAVLLSNHSFAQDPGAPDTVRVFTATGYPGGKVVLSVTGFNDENLAALQIPLKFPSASLVADSVSYVGSRLAGAPIQPVSIDSIEQTLSFGAVYFNPPYVGSGDGLLGKVYFSIKPTAVAETVIIDTVIRPPSVLTFTDPSANEWIPKFKPGKIIIQLQNLPPIWQPIGNKSVFEGDTLKILLKATDPTSEPLTFAALNGPPGSKLAKLSDSTAQFVWVPDFIGPYSSAGSPFKVTFVVSDGVNFLRQDVSIFVVNKNALPALALPDSITSPAEVNISFQVSASDQDRELVTISASNLPSGAIFDGQNPGTFSWTPSTNQVGVYPIAFEAVDPGGGKDFDTVIIIITPAQNFILSMPDVEGFSGEIVTLPVSLVNKDSIGGCQLLLHYDPSALILKPVSRTATRTANWESFSVVLNPGGNQGDIRIVGIADLPNQTNTPPLDTGQGPIVNLTFQISEDPSIAGFTIPVTFKFTDQLDNTLSDDKGDLIGQGSITYKNGSVFIKQFNILLGDINLNGFAFDIGDAVRLANYFIDPVKNALNAQQIANSDVNQDGITASIADLVFLIRRIVEGPGAAGTIQLEQISRVGEAAEIVLERSDHATKIQVGSVVDIGGLHFVFEHSKERRVVPQFSSLLSGFDSWYEDEDGTLRIVIFSFKGKSLPSGNRELFTLDDPQTKLKELAVSDAPGYLMQVTYQEQTTASPSSLRLDQNYPNPFNQETQISFYLAQPGRVKLDIYNIRGQKVRELVNESRGAGLHHVRWDGTNDSGENIATGIYLYRLVAGQESLTRKLTLIK